MYTSLRQWSLIFFLLLVPFVGWAESDVDYPEDWRNWPIVGTGKISGVETPISADLPRIVIDTFKTYNWVNDGKGSAYEIRVAPAEQEAWKKGSTDFEDGPTAILDLTDIGVMLVTGHLLGEAQYGVYSHEGKDLSMAHPSLAPKVCATCHTGYGVYCNNGICRKDAQ